MDKCTHDVRSARWKNIIQNCQQRPANQSVAQWLKENGILEQSYYYWQRKLRNEAYDQMNSSNLPSVQDTNNAVSFVEISAPDHQDNSTSNKPAAVLKSKNISVEIFNGISDQLLSKLLQEVSHA